jgi:F420 biosynthesis protein FbiB-like protein
LTNAKLRDFLRSRRSIRRFKPDPVPDSVIRDILHTASFAPSAHNRQPWRFVVLTDPAAKQNLSDSMAKEFQRDLEKDSLPPGEIVKRVNRSQERIQGAPLVIILCVDMTEMDVYPDTHRKKSEYVIATQSAANAGMQLLLAAHAEGLGGVWVCSPMFAQDTVQKTLNISKTWEPQAMFLLGYPAETPMPRERKNLKDISIFQ